MSPGASQLSKLLPIREAVLGANRRQIKNKNKNRQAKPGGFPLRDEFSPWGPALGQGAGGTPLSTTPLPSQSCPGTSPAPSAPPFPLAAAAAAAGTFPLLSRAPRPRPSLRPKHVPHPALPDHAAARLRSRGSPRRPLAGGAKTGRGLAAGRPAPPRRGAVYFGLPSRHAPPAAPSAAAPPLPHREGRAGAERRGRAEAPAGCRDSGSPPPAAHVRVQPCAELRPRSCFVASGPPAPCTLRAPWARATRVR